MSAPDSQRAFPRPPVAPNAKLRVLVVHNEYQQRGGEDAVVEAEVSLLRARGHPVEVYLRHNDELRGMHAVAAAATAVWSTRTARELTRLIKRFRPDVVHAHNTFALVSPSIYASVVRAGVPVVQTLHNYRLLCLPGTFLRDGAVCEACLNVFPWRGVVHRCYRESVSQGAGMAALIGTHRVLGTYRTKVSRFITLTEFSRSRFVAGGLPENRIAVKPNFADVPILEHQESRSGALFVGRLSPEKGTRVLANASSRHTVTVDVIGAGPDESWLSGIPTLRLLGLQPRSMVYARMRGARYLVVPSVCYENFPLAIVEAFANGLPVLASRLGAMSELVTDGATGLLFEPGSAEDLVAKMAWADAHPGEISQMGRAARQQYEMWYTPEKNYAILLRIYADAMRAKQ